MAENLIYNLYNRSGRIEWRPLKNLASDEAEYHSCYATNNSRLMPLGNKMVVTINLSKPLFVHCVLVVQDLFGATNYENQGNRRKWLMNFEIYVGNSEDYMQNKACPGGPFQKEDDFANSYNNA